MTYRVMGKITFRADDDLVDALETFDASKSEVMREALREYLEAHEGGERTEPTSAEAERETVVDPAPSRRERLSIDDLVRRRVDEHLERRLTERKRDRSDVNVNIALEGVEGAVRRTDADRSAGRTSSPTPEDGSSGQASRCGQCGEELEGDHVYCPNCGEKASNRVFCECGDEVRSDWSFCPGCGRRTPAADVLDAG